MKEMEQLGANHYTRAIIGLNRNQAINLIDQLDVSFHHKEKLKLMI